MYRRALYYYRLFRKGSLSENHGKQRKQSWKVLGLMKFDTKFSDRGLYEKTERNTKSWSFTKLSDLVGGIFHREQQKNLKD